MNEDRASADFCFHYASYQILFNGQMHREGEGQRIRNRIIQKMKHVEEMKKQALARGESVEDWDRIVLVGKKIKQPSWAKTD